MERGVWLVPEWSVWPKGRRAKYYRLTTLGRAEVRAGERRWDKFAAAVAKVFAAR
jgi:DNA-binding PadR family transcriptional regulator